METALRRYPLQLIIFALLYGLSTQLPRLFAWAGYEFDSFKSILQFALEGPVFLRWITAGVFIGLPGLTVWHFILFWKQTRGVASLFIMAVLLLGWPFVTFALADSIRATQIKMADQDLRAALEALGKRLYKLPDHEFSSADDGHFFRRIKVPFQRGDAKRPNQGVDTLGTFVIRVDSLTSGFALHRQHVVQPWKRSDALHEIRPGEYTDREAVGLLRTVTDTLCVVGYSQMSYADVASAIALGRSLGLAVVGVAPGHAALPSDLRALINAPLDTSARYLVSMGPHLRRQLMAQHDRHVIDSLMAATGVKRAYTFLKRKELWLITAESDSVRSGYIQVQRNGPPNLESPDYFPPGFVTYEESVGRWYRFTYRVQVPTPTVSTSEGKEFALRYSAH